MDVMKTVENPAFDGLKVSEIQRCFAWIGENIIPATTNNPAQTSYGLKHIMEHWIGIYVTNEQFKRMMIMCGFIPMDERRLNHSYRIKRVQDKKNPMYRVTVKNCNNTIKQGR